MKQAALQHQKQEAEQQLQHTQARAEAWEKQANLEREKAQDVAREKEREVEAARQEAARQGELAAALRAEVAKGKLSAADAAHKER